MTQGRLPIVYQAQTPLPYRNDLEAHFIAL